MGAPGRGKSAHLYALQRRLPPWPVTRVRQGQRVTVPQADVVFIDDAQHLTVEERRRLFRRRASFVITSHVSHAAELESEEVAVTTCRMEGLDVAHLSAVVARRLAWARLGPGSLPAVTDEQLADLIRRHGDDVRAIFDDLYDAFQRWRELAS